jgi:hypothetical protein
MLRWPPSPGIFQAFNLGRRGALYHQVDKISTFLSEETDNEIRRPKGVAVAATRGPAAKCSNKM